LIRHSTLRWRDEAEQFNQHCSRPALIATKTTFDMESHS